MNGWKLFTVARCARKAIAAASLAVVLVGAGAVGAQASGAWTVVQSPNATLSGGKIESVSCSGPQACTAVGTSLNTSGINVTLAERWDGANWQRQATVNPPNDTDPSVAPDLLGVSCPTGSFCAAVGQYQSDQFTQASMAETWNGQSWTWQPFPVPANSFGANLTAVSCTSASFCEAVGGYLDGNTGLNLTLAATWNGTSWSLQSTQNPDPNDFQFEQFNTVSCASPTSCEAWASGNGGNPGITIAEQWNGSSWQMQTVPSDVTVTSVSCVSAKFCVAVGSDPAYTWNGSAWTAQTTPAPAGSASVSCASRNFCEAVGAEFSNGIVVGVASVWNGSAWSTQATPNPAGGTFTHLNGVSCVAPSSCEAAGYFQLQMTSNNPKALAEAWDGKAWQLQHAVAPRAATYNALAGISCVSASFCEAVGTHFDGSGNQVNLAEMWNGQSWVIQPTPNPTGGGERNVSCVSTQFCEAVGGTTEMWNGTSWTVQQRPSPAIYATQLVSCVSTSFCMAADGGGHVNIWDGTSWSTGPAVAGFSVLTSISCLSASFCEAVGQGPSGENAAMWDGTSWTDQTTPGSVSASFNAVSCTTTSSCQAVGQNFDQTANQVVTFAASWDGSAWTIQPTPNPSATQGSQLTAVSCTSATSCTAVGWYQSSNIPSFGDLQTLAEVWDGTAWTVESTPNPSVTHNLFEGVSCGASQTCTAVGQALDPGGVEATLIETGD